MTKRPANDALLDLLRLVETTPADAPLRQAYAAGRIRQELPSELLLEAVRQYLPMVLVSAAACDDRDGAVPVGMRS